MSADRPVVVGLGEILWDMLPTGTFLGGAPANFAFHANQLGAQGLVVSAVGQDELGDRVFTELQSLKLGTEGINKNSQPTSTVTVTTIGGQPTYIIHENIAWDDLSLETLSDFAPTADAVCFGSLAQRNSRSRLAIQDFVQNTGKHCLRVFDVNLRQNFYSHDVIRESLLLSNVLKLNHEELPVLAQLLVLPPEPDATIRALLHQFGLRMIALTRGGNGSSLYTKWRTSHHPGYPVEHLVDTVGAGDSFTAALVMGFLRQDDLDVLHDRAARLANFVCTQRGATPALPAELRQALLSLKN